MCARKILKSQRCGGIGNWGELFFRHDKDISHKNSQGCGCMQKACISSSQPKFQQESGRGPCIPIAKELLAVDDC